MQTAASHMQKQHAIVCQPNTTSIASGKQNEPGLPPDAGKGSFVFTYLACESRRPTNFYAIWI